MPITPTILQSCLAVAVVAMLVVAVAMLAQRVVRELRRRPEAARVALSAPVRLTGRERAWLVFGSIGLHLFVYCAVFAAHVQNGTEPHTLEEIVRSWTKWDGLHYIALAHYGYQNTAFEQLEKYIVFLPLFPAMIALVGAVTQLPTALAALVGNLLLTPVFAIGFYKLARLDQTPQQAARSVMCALVAPLAIFHLAVYTEIMYLAVGVWGYYFARTGRWWRSGACVLLASLARTSGYFFAVAMGYEFVLQWRARGERWPGWHVLVLAAAPVGLALYLGLNQWVFGDPFKFLYWQHEYWHKFYASFMTGVERAVLIERIDGWFGFWGILTGKTAEAAGVLISAFALMVGAWWLRTSYVLFMLASFWFFMSTAFILSTARYASVLFPIYLLIGGAFEGRPRLFKVYVGVSTALLVVLGFAMTRGLWIA